MFEKIKYKYWEIVPYDWRPWQMWYRFKSFIWTRPTVIKPRYLPYTWCDRMEMLPHMMFEILSQFIEQECSPGHVDWEASDHKIRVVKDDSIDPGSGLPLDPGKMVNVRDEMQELYDWWHNVYMKEYKEVEEILWAEARKHEPIDRWEEDDDKKMAGLYGETLYKWEQNFKTTEDEEIYHDCLMALNKLEANQHKALLARMHRIVNLTGYLWT
ncbi:MAG: hypothetical protein M0R80_02220 [Proteobacteria bacterium]|jgi:hypothetical protein|nr:hypothetical protein [Pseudomonadota bacterium]